MGSACGVLRQKGRAGRGDAGTRSANGSADDPCWSLEDRLLIRACDQLHAGSNIDDPLWAAMTTEFGEMALVEILMLAGFYRTVSYLTNALRLPLESYGAQLPTRPRLRRRPAAQPLG